MLFNHSSENKKSGIKSKLLGRFFETIYVFVDENECQYFCCVYVVWSELQSL